MGKTIAIKTIAIENFKRVKKTYKIFNNKSVVISGRNKTGKTTIYDAFTWCLFGKDSLGRAETNFSIRPIHPKTKELVREVDIMVEVVLAVNSEEIALKRVLKEKYSKSRETQESVFIGNETECFVNGVPTKVSDYKAKVSDILDEELFKLLTDTKHFSEKLDWKERRKIIFRLASTISDLDLFKGNSELAPLLLLLKDNNKTVNNVLDETKYARKEIEKELKAIPARINERTLDDFKDIENCSIMELEAKRVKLQEDIKNAVEDKLQPETVNKTTELIKQINAEEQTLMILKNEARAKQKEEEEKAQASQNEVRAILLEKQSELNRAKASLNKMLAEEEESLETLKLENGKLDLLRKEYKEIQASAYVGDSKCFNCKQELPEEMISTALEQFNKDKAEKLQGNTTVGKRIKEAAEALQDKIMFNKGAIETAKKDIQALENEIMETEKEMQEKAVAGISNNVDYAATPEITKVEMIISRLREELNALKVAAESDDKGISSKEKITALESELNAVNELIPRFKEKENNEKRIAELRAEEKSLRVDYEKHFKILELAEKAITYKAQVIEKTVNDNFNLVSFRLFETLINGGITETCIPILEGVPYDSVNSAGKILIGLDIIQGLQGIFKTKAPVWVDNAETITEALPDLGTQMIKMYANPLADELMFEIVEDTTGLNASKMVVEEIEEIKEEEQAKDDKKRGFVYGTFEGIAKQTEEHRKSEEERIKKEKEHRASDDFIGQKSLFDY